MMMSFRFLKAAVLVAIAMPIHGFVFPKSGHPTATSTSTASITRRYVAARNPTAKQQEQLDKYGPTPETCMEVLFEQLMEQGGGDFYKATGADDFAKEKWETFLAGLKNAQGGGGNDDEEGGPSPKDVSMMFFKDSSKS